MFKGSSLCSENDMGWDALRCFLIKIQENYSNTYPVQNAEENAGPANRQHFFR